MCRCARLALQPGTQRDDMRIFTVQATLRDEYLERFVAASVANASASVTTEEGCRRFDIFRDDADAATVGFNEIYDDAAATDAHENSAHFATWLSATDGMLDQLVWAKCSNLFTGGTASRTDSADPASTGGIGVYQARLSLRTDDADSFIASVTEQARAAVANEEGLLRFDINQNVDVPTEVWLYKVHADPASARDHATAPYTAAHLDRFGDYYSTASPSPISGTNIWPPDAGW